MADKKEQHFHDKLVGDLEYLKLSKIREIYRDVLDDAAGKNLAALKVLGQLVSEEAAFREERATLSRLKRAKLPSHKTLESYDFSFPQRIPKQKILRLFDCDFVEKKSNAVFVGPTGVGKSHLLNALGHAAVYKGIRVRYTRVVDMLNDLTAAQADGTLGRALRGYVKPQLLLLDELGYLPVDKRGSDLLFQIVSARYENGSMVVTTNRPFKEWGMIFDADNMVATAMIDRLMHHGEVIVIKGRSYRMRDKNTDSD